MPKLRNGSKMWFQTRALLIAIPAFARTPCSQLAIVGKLAVCFMMYLQLHQSAISARCIEAWS